MPSVTQGYRHGPGGLYSEVDGSGPYAISASGVATLIGAGGAAVSSAPANGATSSVASSTNSTGLLAANPSRKGATVYNESTAVLYVKLGSTVSVSSYTAQVSPNGYYEVPFGYTGAISGIWATANGNARVTELS